MKVKEPEFIELVVTASCKMKAAELLCKAENELFTSAKLSGHAYSIIFGPSEHDRVRLCIIKGLWRSDGKKAISVPS